MKTRLFYRIGVIICLTLIPYVTPAAEPYYEGKTLRIIAGSSPGGGLDTYSRAIARHMGKHIPGNPTIFVENMPGASTLLSANYLYKVARPDGLTIGNFLCSIAIGQLLGWEGVEFNINKFEIIGVPVEETSVFVFMKASGITSMEKWMSSKTPPKIGSTSINEIASIGSKILQRYINLPVKIVEGYKGTADIRVAAEGGEIAGTAIGWESAKASWQKSLETGDSIVVLQLSDRPHPDLPKVPCVMNFAKTEKLRQLMKAFIIDIEKYKRVYAMPPGTPKELVQIIRKAFQETMKDKTFLAEAEKSKLDINPVTGEEVTEALMNFTNQTPATIAELKEILSPRK